MTHIERCGLVLALSAFATLIGWLFFSLAALAQTPSAPDVYVTETFTVRAQAGAGNPTQLICQVPCGGGSDISCQTPDATGYSSFTLTNPTTCCMQAVARNQYGTSGLSANNAKFRKPGDCTRDCTVNVSDLVCWNRCIFVPGDPLCQ